MFVKQIKYCVCICKINTFENYVNKIKLKKDLFAFELSVIFSEPWITVSQKDSLWQILGPLCWVLEFAFESRETKQGGNLFIKLKQAARSQAAAKTLLKMPQVCSCSLELGLFLFRLRSNLIPCQHKHRNTF